MAGMTKESWYQRLWRPSTAIMYLIVVAFDFIIMPLYVEKVNSDSGINQVAFEQISKFDNAMVQSELIKKINVGDRRWDPLTLQGGGLFHLAFGSILTGAAVTRGLQQRDRERYRNSGFNNGDDSYYDSSYDNYGGGAGGRYSGGDPLP